MIVSRRILLRMRNVWDEVVEKMKTHILFSLKFFRKSCRFWDAVEQDRQFTYNVTLRRIRTFVLLEKTISITYYECVFVDLVIQCAISTRLCNIFPHYLINGTTFVKKLLNIKCVFWCSLQILCDTFLILRINERDMIKKSVLVFM